MNSQLHIHSPKRMVRNHSAEPHGKRVCTAFGASSIPGCIPSCANQPESALCTLSTSASMEAAENSCRSTLSPTHSAVSGSHVLPTCVTAAVSAVTAWENFLRGNTRISEQHSFGGFFLVLPATCLTSARFMAMCLTKYRQNAIGMTPAKLLWEV